MISWAAKGGNIFIRFSLSRKEKKKAEVKQRKKKWRSSIIKKEVPLYSANATFMNSSYGLETAPNEIKTFLQRLHNYAVVATHLVSYGGRRRIKKIPRWKKKMADSIE